MVAGKMVKFQAKRKSKGYYKKRSLPFNKKQVKAIKKIAEKSGELKTKQDITNTITSLVSGSPAGLNCINGLAIAQGDGQNERIGDKITIKDISYHLELKSGTVNDLVRIYAVQYMDDQSQYGNLFPGESGQTEAFGFMPDMNGTNGNKYKVLYDRTVAMGSNNNRSNYSLKLHFNKKNLLTQQVEFDDGLTTVIKGEVEIFVVTNNTTATQLTGNQTLRVRYYD